jgi:hypothetical protein
VEGLIVKKLIGFLGWFGVALVAGTVIIRFTQPELLEWSQRLAIAGLVATLLYTLGQWRDIARSFQAKNVKYGSIAAGTVAVFLGILIAINWIANRQNKRWDVTSNQQFSLSDPINPLPRTSPTTGCRSPIFRRPSRISDPSVAALACRSWSVR